jgi:hypothetical protein
LQIFEDGFEAIGDGVFEVFVFAAYVCFFDGFEHGDSGGGPVGPLVSEEVYSLLFALQSVHFCEEEGHVVGLDVFEQLFKLFLFLLQIFVLLIDLSLLFS